MTSFEGEELETGYCLPDGEILTLWWDAQQATLSDRGQVYENVEVSTDLQKAHVTHCAKEASETLSVAYENGEFLLREVTNVSDAQAQLLHAMYLFYGLAMGMSRAFQLQG